MLIQRFMPTAPPGFLINHFFVIYFIKEVMTTELLHFLGTGYGHELKGMGCQDRIRTESFSGGKTIIAVSDGCSSSKYAEIAAQSNVDVVCNIFKSCSIDSLSYDSFVQMYPEMKKDEEKNQDNLTGCFRFALQKALYDIAKQKSRECSEDIDSRDYCATLLFAVCEEEKICIGHIGDGNIICFDKNGEIVYHSKEENGEDSSHTFFTVSQNFEEHFYYDVIPAENVECIVMFSDGPQNMFRYEHGDIQTGVCEIIAKPVISGEINSDEMLADKLKEYICHAKHYVFDDWSLVVAYKGLKSVRNINPVSLDKIFMKEFNKIVFDEFGNIVNDNNNLNDTCEKKADDSCEQEDAPDDKDKSDADGAAAQDKTSSQTEKTEETKKVHKKIFNIGINFRKD